MKNTVEIDTGRPKKLSKELSPSLDSTEKVQYQIEENSNLKIKINADGLGSLRGSVDNVFRLTSLSNKIKQL